MGYQDASTVYGKKKIALDIALVMGLLKVKKYFLFFLWKLSFFLDSQQECSTSHWDIIARYFVFLEKEKLSTNSSVYSVMPYVEIRNLNIHK